MRLFKKKGFSLVELIVVIAIIAILAAMILPNLSSSEATKGAVQSAAKDFYSATQRLFTKYSKYENYLSEQMKADQADALKREKCVLIYDKSLGGNYPSTGTESPTGFTVALAMGVKSGQIEYVDANVSTDAAKAMQVMFSQEGVKEVTEFERIFAQEVDTLIEQQDGVYYAIVTFKSNADSVTKTPNTNSVRVVATGYAQNDMPKCGSDFNSYKNTYLHFKEYGRLHNGRYFGACSSYRVGGKFIGEPGTYFSIV